MPDTHEGITLHFQHWLRIYRALREANQESIHTRRAWSRIGLALDTHGQHGELDAPLTIRFPAEEVRLVSMLGEHTETPAPPARYTVAPGRHIYRDGKPFIYIGRWDGFTYDGADHYVPPTEPDALAHEFCAYLNGKEKHAPSER